MPASSRRCTSGSARDRDGSSMWPWSTPFTRRWPRTCRRTTATAWPPAAAMVTVAAAAVRDVGEVVEDRHLHERGAIQRIDHPQLGEVVVPHSPLRFRGTPLVPLVPSPALGADNRDVFGKLGLSDEEIDRLRDD